MKHSVKKPVSGFVNKKTGRKSPAKKKKPKKLDTGDKLRAVLAAAVMILAAAVASLSVMYFHSVKAGNTAVSETGAGELSSGENTARKPGAETSAANSPPLSAARPAPPAGGGSSSGQPSTAPVSSRPAPSSANTTPPAASSSRAPERPVVSAPSSANTNPPAANTNPPAANTNPPAASSVRAPERPVSKGSLGFVIDDAGHNLRDLEPFLKFPGILTIAVLPGLPHSAESARRIRAAGKEVFLHQPMEPLGGHDPGPGAIRSGMGKDEIRAIVSRNLDELWPVAGMNNHEGSRITMNEEAMETILDLCRERGILFLDSRTTADTAAPRTARRLGMVIGERDVFVDNVQERKSMAGYIDTGLLKAEQNGSAIMIGHAWSPELAPLLVELFPDLTGRGYSFSRVSKIIGGLKP